MQRLHLLLLVLGGVSVPLAIALLPGFASGPEAGERLVFTAIPVPETASGDAAIDWRYPERSRLMALDPDHPERAPVVLTEGFQAARAPAVSFDGKYILFAGRKDAGESWRIWEMRADGSGARPITDGLPGATDPAYLPHDAIVFSGRLSEADDSHALFIVNRDGTGLQRITFHPGSDALPVLLQDGRVVTASRSAETGATVLLGMRYDGTRAELLYRNDRGSPLPARVQETADRRLVFVESPDGDGVGGDLVSVSLAYPLHTRADLAPEDGGRFHSVAVGPAGPYAVSYRTGDTGTFALYAFDPAAGRVGDRLFGDSGYDAVEPVWTVARTEPMGFMSIVDPQTEAGWLYCLNADNSTLPAADPGGTGVRVRVDGVDGLLGEVPLEADGSFYLELPTDTPLRFQTLDAGGAVVRGPSAWIWLRPNEQRGCVGCHEDRELAPENRVPAAVTHPPVSLLPSKTMAARSVPLPAHEDRMLSGNETP